MENRKMGQSTGPTASTSGGRAGREDEGARGMQGQRGMTRGRGGQESEDVGMRQATMMLREAREEGDPELMQRAEDLHARQQKLGEREQSLRERDEQLRSREQGLRERQTRVTGRDLGATDYTDDIHIQNRR
jgi:hypothetical protein